MVGGKKISFSLSLLVPRKNSLTSKLDKPCVSERISTISSTIIPLFQKRFIRNLFSSEVVFIHSEQISGIIPLFPSSSFSLSDIRDMPEL